MEAKVKSIQEIIKINNQLKPTSEENGINSGTKENKYFEIIKKCDNCGDVKWFKNQENGKLLSRECKCEKVLKYKKLSILDTDSDEKTFSNAKPESEIESKYLFSFIKFVSKFEEVKSKGLGLLLSGNAGTGKTFYANAIANELMKNNYSVLSFNFSSYLNEIKKDFANSEINLLETIKAVDLVVIDDLGSESISEGFGKEKLFNLVDTIYRNKKPVIITTNLNSKTLSEHLAFNSSDKILDRLSEKCKPFNFSWESRRRKIQKELWEGIF